MQVVVGMLNYKKRIYGKTKILTIEQLKEKFSLKKFDYIKLAILFGSRASQDFTSQSDYDFAVLTKDIDTKWGTIAKCWDDIGDTFGLNECDYDIIDLNRSNKNILKSIMENYIILKGDEDELQRLFNRN